MKVGGALIRSHERRKRVGSDGVKKKTQRPAAPGTSLDKVLLLLEGSRFSRFTRLNLSCRLRPRRHLQYDDDDDDDNLALLLFFV